MDKKQLLTVLQNKCRDETVQLIEKFKDLQILHQEDTDPTFAIEIQSDFDCTMLMFNYSKICSIDFNCDFWQQLFDEIFSELINKLGMQIDSSTDDIPFYLGIPHTKKLAMFGEIFIILLSNKFDQYLENKELYPDKNNLF